MSNAIEVENLTKVYGRTGSGQRALRKAPLLVSDFFGPKAQPGKDVQQLRVLEDTPQGVP